MYGAFAGMYKLYEVTLVHVGVAKAICATVGAAAAAGGALGFAMVPIAVLRISAAERREVVALAARRGVAWSGIQRPARGGVERHPAALATRKGVAWSGIRLWAFVTTGPLVARLADQWSYGHLLATGNIGCIALAGCSLYHAVRSAASEGTFSTEQPLIATLAVSGSLCLVVSSMAMFVIDPACSLLKGLHLLGASHAVLS